MEPLVLFYPEGHEAHARYGHPERPERLEAVRRGIIEAGCWQPEELLSPYLVERTWLMKIHTPDYLDQLQSASQEGEDLDLDTYLTPASWQLALNAAGGAAAVAEAVWDGHAQTGFALCRPPGHHATPAHNRSRGHGFCLLNNIALAARHLLDLPDSPAHQLAIVDLDLHHGNGTQAAFWRVPEVGFISTHQVPLYPGSGGLDETGADAGSGYTANLPMLPGTGDQGFQAAMDDVILPLLDRWQPQMLLVSMGFDPHWRDPLGSLQLSAQGLYSLMCSLVTWANEHCAGKIAVFLEGGYDLEAGQACGQATAAALTGQTFWDPLGKCPRPESQGWRQVLATARQIWNV